MWLCIFILTWHCNTIEEILYLYICFIILLQRRINLISIYLSIRSYSERSHASHTHSKQNIHTRHKGISRQSGHLLSTLLQPRGTTRATHIAALTQSSPAARDVTERRSSYLTGSTVPALLASCCCPPGALLTSSRHRCCTHRGSLAAIAATTFFLSR